MTVDIPVAERLRLLPVSGDLFGVLFVDLVKFRFADLALCDIVAVSVGISVPREKLPFAFMHSVSAPESDLIGYQAKEVFFVLFITNLLLYSLIKRFSVSGESTLTYLSTVICKSYFLRSFAIVDIIGEAW